MIMSRFSFFCETYFKEIGFLVLIALMTFGMICGADCKPCSGSVYPVLGLITLSFIFCLETFIIGHSAYSPRDIRNLKPVLIFSAVAVFGILLAYSSYLQQKFAVNELIKLSYCALISAIICGWYLDYRIAILRRLKKLREVHPDCYLRMMIAQKRILSEELQLKLLSISDAEQQVYRYMQYTDLLPAAEMKLLQHPYAVRIIKHLPTYVFSPQAEAYMFMQPNAAELVYVYVNNGNVLCAENEKKMFDLPNASDIVSTYICNHSLSSEAEMLLFDLPEAKDFIQFYAEVYQMSDEARTLAKTKGWI